MSDEPRPEPDESPEADEPIEAEADPQDDPADDDPEKISIRVLRERAAANPDGPEAQIGKRIAKQIADATGVQERFKRVADEAAKAAVPKFNLPAVESLKRLQEDAARHDENMKSLQEAIDSGRRRQEERADKQAEATIEIAQAQERLRALQEQSLELAKATADATAKVATTQEAVLATIQEELAVLRDQHDTLQEQVTGQKRLLVSGWAGGVVMEWTLLTAIIAAVATVVLGVMDDEDIPTVVWVGSGVIIVLLGVALAIWQARRKP